MKFPLTELTDDELALRRSVRELLTEHLPWGSYHPGLGMAAGHSRDFSRLLAQHSLLGMAIPAEYGGGGRSAVERFIVTEELLAVGAPIAGHYVADRQSGPTILRFGSEEQRRRYLPAICRGEINFSILLSEPDSGSDLASVRTRAERVDGGWLLNGTKVWTSGAHLNEYALALCRTDGKTEDKHAGLSQFIVDLSLPGVTINPIYSMDGHHGFNEVVLSDVFLTDDALLGEPGMGWRQVNSELSYERSGPDRFLSPFTLVRAFLEARGSTADAATVETLGRITARLWSIRLLSLSVARALDAGQAPAVESSVVKDLGTVFEQQVVEALHDVAPVEVDPSSESTYLSLLATAIMSAPTFTLRGGTTEVLRSIASKGLSSLSTGSLIGDGTPGEEVVARLLLEECPPELVRQAEIVGWSKELWDILVDAGVPWISIGEAAGGSGGSIVDLCAAMRYLGRSAAPVPVAETSIAAWLLEGAGLRPERCSAAPCDGTGGAVSLSAEGDQWRLDGTVDRVPFASVVDVLVVLVDSGSGSKVVRIPTSKVRIEPGRNLAGEPRDRVHLASVLVDETDVALTSVDAGRLRQRGALLRANAMAGALEAITEMSVRYAEDRRQFGKPIGRFQAVQQHLVRIAEEAAVAGMAARAAARSAAVGSATVEIAAAKAVTGEAASEATRRAHQVHGAVGTTAEHALQLFTRRLWSWRDEFGTAREWCERLGTIVHQAGAGNLWSIVSEGSEALRD